jgi:hypothetical protein
MRRAFRWIVVPLTLMASASPAACSERGTTNSPPGPAPLVQRSPGDTWALGGRETSTGGPAVAIPASDRSPANTREYAASTG